MKASLILLAVFTLFSCQVENKRGIDGSPLAVVVKFISAESFRDTIEAKKHLNLDKVYSKFIDNENKTANEVWKSKLRFEYALSNDNKFTNHFNFSKYTFNEVIENNKSRVVFISKNKEDSMESIEYSLELNESNNWVIVDILPKK